MAVGWAVGRAAGDAPFGNPKGSLLSVKAVASSENAGATVADSLSPIIVRVLSGGVGAAAGAGAGAGAKVGGGGGG